MAQLVGKNCVFCNERISDELRSRFCPDCNNPRHDKCARPPAEQTDTACPQCGAAVDPAKKVPAPVPLPPPSSSEAPLAPIPVARVCPNCRSANCKRVRPRGLVAFKWDRVCRECDTRYTPPTPRAVARLFVIIGIGFMLFGFVVARPNPKVESETVWLAAFAVAFLVLGARAFGRGLKLLSIWVLLVGIVLTAVSLFASLVACGMTIGVSLMWLGWRAFDHGMSALAEPGKV